MNINNHDYYDHMYYTEMIIIIKIFFIIITHSAVEHIYDTNTSQ